VQDLLDARVVLVVLGAQLRVVVEVAACLGLQVHHGDGELAIVEVPAELIAVAEDRDLQSVQRAGAAVQDRLAQDRGDEAGEVIGFIEPADGRGGGDLVVGDGLLGRVLQQRAGVIRAVRIVGRLEIDGVGLAPGPGLAGALVGAARLPRSGIWPVTRCCCRTG